MEAQVVVALSSVPITVELAEAVGRLELQRSALPVVKRLLLAVVGPVFGNTDELALLAGEGRRVMVVVLLLWRVTTDVPLADVVASEGVGYTVTVTTAVEMLTVGVWAAVTSTVDSVVRRLVVKVGTGYRVLLASVLETVFVTLLLAGKVGSAVRVASVSCGSVSGIPLMVTVMF